MRILSLLAISILLLSACKKEDVSLKLKNETSEQMRGKWMVQRIIYDHIFNEDAINKSYKPLKLLSSKIETIGTANDYFDFQPNALVKINTSYSYRLKSYRVWNPLQVLVGQEEGWIEKLTATELVLQLERNGTEQYKSVTRIYLSRSR